MSQPKALNDVRVRGKCRITRIAGQGLIRKKLLDMGLVPGSSLEVLRIAPLGDPVEIRIKGYSLSLRKDEAENIMIEVL